MAVLPNYGFRRLNSLLGFHKNRTTSSSFYCCASLSIEKKIKEEDEELQPSISTNSSSTPKTKPSSFFPKKNQTLELVCESFRFKGKGVCKVEETGFVVMCDRALPGERFIGRVTRKKGSYAEVQKLKTITPHNDLVEAPCEYASACGGCKTQNLSYEAQVRAKEQQVHELVIHVGNFSVNDVEFANVMKPIVPCDIQFNYRNKINDYALGLHAPGFFDKVLNVQKCLLQSEAANTVLAIVQDCWRDPELGLSPYCVPKHVRFLKHLTCYYYDFCFSDAKTGSPELMVNFVTCSYKPELLKPLVDKISSISEVLGKQNTFYKGKSSISEALRGITFQISANSFFQTNTYSGTTCCRNYFLQKVLYRLIEECASLGNGSELFLTCFVELEPLGETCLWLEMVPQSISDARRNAENNGISNATFIQGDLNKISDDFGDQFPRPDIVISDPNRPGMHLKLIKYLLKLRAPRLIYVSCNPATCARDLDYLCHGLEEKNIKGCYKLKSLQPVDMFPHTPHIECVCLLELE
ncbi:hypothetical protein MKW92_013234 [Papaver armeniacum]|nr:hypothetical protein MKW92_013234 [Papaver armeniacum]